MHAAQMLNFIQAFVLHLSCLNLVLVNRVSQYLQLSQLFLFDSLNLGVVLRHKAQPAIYLLECRRHQLTFPQNIYKCAMQYMLCTSNEVIFRKLVPNVWQRYMRHLSMCILHIPVCFHVYVVHAQEHSFWIASPFPRDHSLESNQ